MTDSFEIIWQLLDPPAEYSDRRDACLRLWRGMNIQKQRQIYATFVWQRQQGFQWEENPFFAISHCNPKPFNFNGTGSPLPEETKLFIAKYKDRYGLYSKLDVEAFEMTDPKPFN